jgi:hypothetical protein
MKIEEFQLGANNKMNWEQRLILHNLWLDSIHRELKEKMETKEIIEILNESDLEKEKM